MTKIIDVSSHGIATDDKGFIALDPSELDILRYYFTIPAERLKVRLPMLHSSFGKLLVQLVIDSQTNKKRIHRALELIVDSNLVKSDQLIVDSIFGEEEEGETDDR